MKIAVLHDSFPPYSIGGADMIAHELSRAFKAAGHEVVVITTSRKKGDAGSKVYNGLVVHTIATNYQPRWQAYISLWNPKAVREVQKILSRFKPDVVHVHNVHGYLSYRSLKVAKDLGAKVVLTAHDVMSFNYQKLTDFIDPYNLEVPMTFNYRTSVWKQLKKNRFRYNPLRNILIRRRLQKSVDKIVAVSEALKEALTQNSIANVEVIHNGIDVVAWQESSETIEVFRKKHVLGEKVIFFGGRLSAIKGANKLLEALSQVVRTTPDLELLVVGKEDAYAKEMRREVKRFGLEGKVKFTGWIEGNELHAAYLASSVVVVPSLCFDSFPTTNLEAGACKKAVIATCFGGSRELIEDGVSGYIVNPYNTRMLVDRITKALEPQTGTILGEALCQKIAEHFNLQMQVEKYENLFKAIEREVTA